MFAENMKPLFCSESGGKRIYHLCGNDICSVVCTTNSTSMYVGTPLPLLDSTIVFKHWMDLLVLVCVIKDKVTSTAIVDTLR